MKSFVTYICFLLAFFGTFNAFGNQRSTKERIVSYAISSFVSAGVSTVMSVGMLTIVRKVIPEKVINYIKIYDNQSGNLPISVGNNVAIVTPDTKLPSKEELHKKSISAVMMGACILSFLLNDCIAALVDKHVQVKRLKNVSKISWKADPNTKIRMAGVLSTFAIFFLDHIYRQNLS